MNSMPEKSVNAIEECLRAIERITGSSPKQSGDEWIGYCPVHEADGKGHKPSLTLKAGDTVPVVVNCHAGCDGREILKALGMTNGNTRAKASIIATYSYQDESGAVVREKLRYEPKDFRIRHRDASGAWVYKAGPGPAVLYRLPEVTTAIAKGRTIFVCEGEKDCDRLAKAGLVATTNIEGAAQPQQRAKWRKEYTAQLAGAARVILLPDNDGPGKAHMATIAAQLASQVGEVRVLELPGLPAKGDVSDWLNQGHTLDELKALARSVTAESPVSRAEDAGNAAKPERESEPDGKASAEESGKTTRRRKEKRSVSEEWAADLVIEAPKREGYICLRVGEYPEAVESAEQNLIEADVGIYQRGILCRVSSDPVPTVRGISRPAGVTTIKEVTETWLLNQLDRRIEFEKWDGRSEDFKRCHAPKEIAQRLLHNAGSWKFPTLTGIITAPTLRPDGSILDQPGYDAATGLFFDPQGEQYPPIPASPTREEGQAALQRLTRDILENRCVGSDDNTGFSFATPAAKSAALSALLTPLVRHTTPTAPLHLISARRAGSGKSLLADAAALLATGRTATIFDLGEDGDEQEKRMLSIFASGDLVVNLDNLEGPLGGKILCKALTAQTFSGRLLGASKIVTVPTAVAWLATGNNVVVAEDSTRRVVLCQLDPQTESPEKREFARNLLEWIPEHRPALVVAALTALRAYVAAGCPKQPLPVMGSFEDWHRLVRSALVWLGEADPLGDTDQMEDTDPTRLKLRALLSAWHQAFGSVPTTCKEVVARANATMRGEHGEEVFVDEPLRDVLLEYFADDRKGNGSLVSTRSLGKFISKNKGRIECGARLESFGDMQNAVQWRVAIVDKSRFSEPKKGGSGEFGEFNEFSSPLREKVSVPIAAIDKNDSSMAYRGNNSPNYPNSRGGNSKKGGDDGDRGDNSLLRGKLSVSTGCPYNSDSSMEKGGRIPVIPVIPPNIHVQDQPELPSRTAPTPSAAPSPGKSRPMACTWNGLGRLITKCDAPEPNADSTGCANCGASKPAPGASLNGERFE